MKHYKGTYQQCEDYNIQVSQNQKYQNGMKWSDIYFIDNDHYILAHPSLASDMEYVEELPEVLD